MKRFFILCLLLSCTHHIPAASATTDPFPVYPVIRQNVDFWLNIYTRYDVTEGILHDSEDLSVVYGKIVLLHPLEPDARNINEKRIQYAREHCRAVLNQLIQPSGPLSEEAVRFKSLFGGNADPERYRQALNRIRCQIGQKSRFLEGLIRSGEYMDEFRGIFMAQGLPPDLMYLAHVESSFNPNATSRCGAAGIWQFMPVTGKRFMKVDNAVDERRDPIVSTRAAAAYLKENYEKLGSWPLALTAYNHGVNGMLRAQSEMGSYERIFKGYDGRTFGFASRNFYPSFLAARESATRHERYFGKVGFASPRQTITLAMPGYVYLSSLIRDLELDMATVRELNPALQATIYKGQKYVPMGYHLRIPAQHGQSTENLLARLPAGIFRTSQKQDRIHVVQKGDTALRIARMHKVNLSDLIETNNLCRRALIHPGQKLKIPRSGNRGK